MSDLSSTDWYSIFKLYDFEDQVSAFTSAFLKVWDVYTLAMQHRAHYRPTLWMNKSALQSIHSRYAAYCVYLRNRSPANLLTYKKTAK